jgi:tetratricopeptide (TPR) repeat protein
VWLVRLEEEHGNLRAVVSWALEHGAVELAARLIAALTEFWALQNHRAQAFRWMEAALASGDSLPTAVRAKALAAHGLLAREVGDNARAQMYLEQSLALFRDLRDRRGIASVLADLAHVVIDARQGDLTQVAALLAESLTLAQGAGDSAGVAWARVWLGHLAIRQGRYAAARAELEEGLALYRKQGYKRGAAWAVLWLGRLAFFQGDYPALRTLFEERQALEQALGNKYAIADSLFGQGIAALCQGQYVQAAALCEASLVLLQEVVDIRGSSAGVLEVLGHAALALGAHATAGRRYKETLAVCRESSTDQGIIAYAIEGVAELAAVQGRPERAARLCGAGAALGADPFWLYDPRREERIIAAVRAQLDEAAFAAAWAAGRALTLEQAIAEALGC